MRAKVEHEFVMNRVKVWFYTRLANGQIAVHRVIGEDLWQDEQVDQNASLPEPSLTLPYEMLEALVSEASDFLPPSAASERHLEDARVVRDRLLALVEKRN